MTTLTDLVNEMDRVDALPIAARAAERLILYRQVESALRECVAREETLFASVQKFRPALRELSLRLTALEKIGPREVPGTEMLREYRAALARAIKAIHELERASLTIFERMP